MPSAARSPYRLSSAAAMAASVTKVCPSAKRPCRLPSDAEAIQLENVVRRAYQRPFALDLLESSQQELPEAPGLFDLPNHRFDDCLARRIDGRAGLRVELAGHPVDDRGARRQRSTRTRPRSLAMFLLPRRNVRVDGRVCD